MDGSGEIITIFIGQAGTQLANACWELFCLEHGVSPNGCLRQGYYPTDPAMCAFFSESQVRKLTPRTMIIDLEPSVIDEIKTGDYKQLFSPDSLVTGKQDASNNYARGYYSIGREAIPLVLSRISKIWEACSKPAGFIVFRSISGGTGSGFASLLLQQLSTDYPKTITLDFVIYPSPNISAVIVEPYNALFSIHSSLDHVDCSFLVDNEALYNICASNLDVNDPTFTNLNRLLAQITSSVTASMRFESAVNVSLQELQTNLVPYPRIHFSLTTYAPLISPRRGMYAEITTQRITNDCFIPSNQVGINYQPTTTVPGGDLAKSNRTVVMISNNTAMRHRWSMLTRKYDLMYQKRAFFHHYIGEGMEEDFFKEAREDMMTLISDYKEIEK